MKRFRKNLYADLRVNHFLKDDMLPQKYPREFKDFRFDVQAFLDND